MPSYTYHCAQCETTFTELRRVTDRDKALRCACGNLTKNRLIDSFYMKTIASTAPRSLTEKLAGPRTQAPVCSGPTSVLGHICHSGCGCN